MITTENKALKRAEQLVKGFAEKHKDSIAQNRKNGDSLGVTCGIPIYSELDKLREKYLSEVIEPITRTTNYFNVSVVRYVLGRDC